MPQSVCIDCRYVNGQPSGIGELTANLAREVPPLLPDVQFVLLRHPAADSPLCDAPNVRELVAQEAANGPATMWLLPRMVELSGIDLFHAPFNIMPAGLPMPCVVTLHDTMWLDRPHLCEQGWRGRLRGYFFRHGMHRAMSRAAAIVTPSVSTMQDVAALMPPAVTRTHVIPSGVSQSFSPGPIDAASLRQLGLDAAGRFVLTVGQWAPYKNHEGAVRAFALVAARWPDLELVLVQRQGRKASNLLALAEQLGLAGRVKILRGVRQADLVQLYRAAAALLHPSFCEGFGNPLAEAMACGCPVVTSSISAMPEVTGGAALLADPADTQGIASQLARVIAEPDLAKRLTSRGLERVQSLSWPAFAQAHAALYERLLPRAVR